MQFELLPGAKRVFDDSRTDGVITGLHWAYDTLGKGSTKRFLIVHVKPYPKSSIESLIHL